MAGDARRDVDAFGSRFAVRAVLRRFPLPQWQCVLHVLAKTGPTPKIEYIVTAMILNADERTKSDECSTGRIMCMHIGAQIP